jgi:hypothetical protein
MNARLSLCDLSPRHQAEVERQLARHKPIGIARAQSIVTDAPKRIRQSSKGPNKTEAAFAAFLRAELTRLRPGSVVLEQAITLRIANGSRFTPDIVTVSPAGITSEQGSEVAAYEVKGFARDDAIVKLKVAASLYPWIQFVLVTAGDRTRTIWNMEEVRP